MVINVKDSAINEILKKHGGDDIKSLLSQLFDSRILDPRLCKIALMRKHYFKLLQENEDLKEADAKEITAEDFSTSVASVEKAIYYYRRVEI